MSGRDQPTGEVGRLRGLAAQERECDMDATALVFPGLGGAGRGAQPLQHRLSSQVREEPWDLPRFGGLEGEDQPTEPRLALQRLGLPLVQEVLRRPRPRSSAPMRGDGRGRCR